MRFTNAFSYYAKALQQGIYGEKTYSLDKSVFRYIKPKAHLVTPITQGKNPAEQLFIRFSRIRYQKLKKIA